MINHNLLWFFFFLHCATNGIDKSGLNPCWWKMLLGDQNTATVVPSCFIFILIIHAPVFTPIAFTPRPPNPRQKLHAFLFAEGLVLTRPVTRPEGLAYQVCGRPLRLVELDVINIPDGEARLGGSFRGAFGDKGASSWMIIFHFSFTHQSACIFSLDLHLLYLQM